jgi:hypothetical protein
MPNESLETALELWRRGLSVIPVPRPSAHFDGKTPTIAWREFQSRRASEDEIRGWFSGAPMNVAVVTGAISGVVVIDADDQAAVDWCVKNLPRTPWQVRTSRGFHLFYRHPGTLVRNGARLDVRDGQRLALDVRGDGGYVIGPGSLHASGAFYRPVGNWDRPREAMPYFWRGWLRRPARPAAACPVTPRPTVDLVARARRYLAAIPPPTIGAGSDSATLSAACRLVRGFMLSEADALELLLEWAGNRPGWTREWIAEKVRNAARYGSEPVGGLLS